MTDSIFKEISKAKISNIGELLSGPALLAFASSTPIMSFGSESLRFGAFHKISWESWDDVKDAVHVLITKILGCKDTEIESEDFTSIDANGICRCGVAILSKKFVDLPNEKRCLIIAAIKKLALISLGQSFDSQIDFFPNEIGGLQQFPEDVSTYIHDGANLLIRMKNGRKITHPFDILTENETFHYSGQYAAADDHEESVKTETYRAYCDGWRKSTKKIYLVNKKGKLLAVAWFDREKFFPLMLECSEPPMLMIFTLSSRKLKTGKFERVLIDISPITELGDDLFDPLQY